MDTCKKVKSGLENYEEEEEGEKRDSERVRVENADSKARPAQLPEGFGDTFNPNEQR